MTIIEFTVKTIANNQKCVRQSPELTKICLDDDQANRIIQFRSHLDNGNEQISVTLADDASVGAFDPEINHFVLPHGGARRTLILKNSLGIAKRTGLRCVFPTQSAGDGNQYQIRISTEPDNCDHFNHADIIIEC